MSRSFTVAVVVVGSLNMAGCAIPDAIAYGVKATKGNSHQGRAATTAPTYTAPVAADSEPPSVPVSIQRESVEVEQLSPPSMR